MNYELLRPQEVSKILKISKSLIYRMLEDGTIPSIRFGRTVRVKSIDLEAFVDANVMNGQRESDSEIPRSNIL